MQRADVDAERARPVVDAIPVERAAARRETPRDLARKPRADPWHCATRKSLRHEVAPDVIVIGLVEQRAVEIEQHGVDGRPVGPRNAGSGDMRGVSYGPRWMPAPETLVDFHTHSHFSDGVLAPAALVERARNASVGTLALTDHDTTAGLGEARAACAAAGIRFVPGVELSAQLARPNYSHRRPAGRRVARRIQFAPRRGPASGARRA